MKGRVTFAILQIYVRASFEYLRHLRFFYLERHKSSAR